MNVNTDAEECNANKAQEANSDELIMAQEKAIESEIAENCCLVGPRLELTRLSDEYSSEDLIYQQKIADLQENYLFIRKTRPDGNCFFRAFTFKYFEYLLNDKQELNRFWPIAEQSKEQIVKQGYTEYTIEDFYDMFMDILKRISEGMTLEELIQLFNEQSSDFIVCYIRLITSVHLQRESDFFSNFIEGHRTVVEFCKQEVEPMYKESDHIHIIALTTVFKVGVRIVYMDRGAEGKINTHDFGIDDNSSQTPKVFLLYRPGHYDILYPKD
ncbi:ubiquitin thioesterase OTUB1-like [Oppia nitens]|uniref:ubiquitin thioesterase OTUB1-like n=1 Tax=Oppia nitens TaxID=1686743 RepID=UPI0023D9E9C7|nr:ubiquitin thioesterase OTUB1-like [Oppia nitens]